MLQRGDSFEKGYPAMPTVSANLKREIWGVPPCIIQSSSEQHSQTSISLNHAKRVLIPQDASDRMMPCTMFGCPLAVPGRSVVSANNLYWEGHGKLIAFLALKRHTKEEGSEALSETDGQEGGTSGLVEYCAGRRYCPALLHRFCNVTRKAAMHSDARINTARWWRIYLSQNTLPFASFCEGLKTPKDLYLHSNLVESCHLVKQMSRQFKVMMQGHQFHQDSLTKEKWILELSPGNAGPSSEASLCKYYTLVSFHQYEYLTVCRWITRVQKLGPPKSHRLPADRV